MKKTILITGSTDGIGLATARELAREGHHILLHGRNPDKLAEVADSLSTYSTLNPPETYQADLSDLHAVQRLAEEISEQKEGLDVLINNAGVFKTANPITREGLDVRFIVNTIAPYYLTKKLLPQLQSGRVVNLSSAAQSPVDRAALAGNSRLDDMSAYAQSKLALTMWSRYLAQAHPKGPMIVAVNPASLLGSKMVQEGFGVAGADLQIGVDILIRAALSDEFSQASGLYYDNDKKRFAKPHPEALNDRKSAEVIQTIDTILAHILA